MRGARISRWRDAKVVVHLGLTLRGSTCAGHDLSVVVYTSDLSSYSVPRSIYIAGNRNGVPCT